MEMMDPIPAILAVVGVVGLALWWLGRKGAVRFGRARFRRPSRRLESIERLALSPHHAIFLVRVDDRAMVVAQSPAGLQVLEGAGSASGGAALRAAAGERG